MKICKFGKGRKVAILNLKDYYAKLELIVADTSKFVEIPIKSMKFIQLSKKKTPSATS